MPEATVAQRQGRHSTSAKGGRQAMGGDLALLELRYRTASEVGLPWAELREIASAEPPPLPGLKARWWRAERRSLCARFLFVDGEALAAARGLPTLEDPLAGAPWRSGAPAERVDAVRSAATELERPVFILSAPRAGSTMLYDLLSLGDGIRSLGRENLDLIDGIPALNLAARGFDSQALDERDATADVTATLKACILAELGISRDGACGIGPSPPRRKIRFLDKTPENALRVPFLLHVFPDARFIVLTRDLRPHLSSIIEAWRHGGFVAIPRLPGFPRDRWSFLLPPGWRQFAQESLGKIASFQWYAANHAILHALEALTPVQWTKVDYADLVARPAAEIERLCDFMGIEPGGRLREALSRPIPLSATTISSPSPIKWKSNRDFDPALAKPLQPLAGRLRNLGAKRAPSVLRTEHRTLVRFACFVDELTPRAAPVDARVDRSLCVQIGGSLPLRLLPAVRHRERFLSEHPVLWRHDAATGIWCPLWLRQHQVWLAAALRAGSSPPTALSGRFRDQCHAAGILTTAGIVENRRRQGVELRAFGSMLLERNRFCHLPALLDPVLARAITRYYKAMIASGDWPLGDAQVEQRHGWHNERVARFLHNQLTPFLSQVAGVRLKPTYCFASAYRGGAVLDAHLDREQCDYTVSLLIDEEGPADDPAWPLWFQAVDGRQSLTLSVTDAVLFRGCELPHWRDPATPDHRQINLLFHFVPDDWPGVMD